MLMQIFKTKTVIFNNITANLAILAMPEIIQILPEASLKWITIINVIGNVILRVFFTTQPIEDK